MIKQIKFVLTGPNAGKSITLGEYGFVNGVCTVTVSGRDGDNQPLPDVGEIVGVDRITANLNAGVANIARHMERAYSAFPEGAEKAG